MMNNQPQAQAKAGAAAVPNLIRVDQVSKLPHLSEAEKAQAQNRVQQLWDILNNGSETDARRRQAHQHLTVMSQQIMQAMRSYTEQQKQSQQMRQQASNTTQATHTSPVPASQSQPQPEAQTQAQPQPQTQPASVPTTNGQFLPEVQQQLDAQSFVLPPAMTQGTKQADDWLKEARSRFGSALQRAQQANTQKANLSRLALTKQQQGGLSVTEQNTFNEKVAQFNKYIQESHTFLERFHEQQKQFKAQRAQQSNTQAQSAPSNDQQRRQASSPVPQPAQQAAQAMNQQNVAAAATSAAGPGRSAPQNPGNQQQQQPSSQSLPNTPGSAQPVGYPATSNQPPQRLQYPNHAGSATLTAPGPISPVTQQPQQPMQPLNQPHLNRPGINSPVGHPAQRSMTEPALSAISGYALDQSEDGTVLSKPKLRELIGEVLGKDNDGVSPDAEDLCLQFVDDFVDDIISQGCKMAKLRGSNHLDARDIQVVLERQYNMRIPGFSTDELRVARRPQPAVGWTQRSATANTSK